MTAAKVETKVREIPVGQLNDAPWNARKSFDEASLLELCGSIRERGILTPLVVRDVSDIPEDERSIREHDRAFEIVAGHRRFRAAQRVGLKAVPCIVRDLDEDQAREDGLVDNLQRVDLPAMEEAEGYGSLLKRPGATIETVAAAVGKSQSYVGRRLKLLDAIEPVREALKCAAIEVGHALELARLSPKQQQNLLDYLDVGYSAPDDDDDDEEDSGDEGEVVAELVPGRCAICDGDDAELADNELTWANPEHTVCSDPDCVSAARRKRLITVMVPTRTTVAELRGRIARTELRVLGSVPFPLDDEIPPMACTVCPKRAAGAASLFADIAEDTCTDPECLSAKLRVWVKAQLEAADRAGRKLAMLYDGHAQDKAGVSRWGCIVGAECASQEPAIWVSGSRIGHLVQICRDKKCSEHGAGAQASASSSGSKGGVAKPATPKRSAEDKRKAEAQKAERAKLQQKVAAEEAYRERLWKALAEASVPDLAELHIARQACAQMAIQGGALVARALGMSDDAFDYGKRDAALSRVAALPYKAVLRAAALSWAVTDVGVSDYGVLQGEKPRRMEELAALLGVDLIAIRMGAPAKLATGKKLKQGAAAKKEPILNAESRKRIAAVQKKRWAELKKPAAKKAAKKAAGKRGAK